MKRIATTCLARLFERPERLGPLPPVFARHERQHQARVESSKAHTRRDVARVDVAATGACALNKELESKIQFLSIRGWV